jgi:hypothetical protein
MDLAEILMMEFAEDTELISDRNPRRYLWTDAFAVCNLIQLHKQKKNETYKQMAIKLVDQVHSVLGKHRKDDTRKGWLSKDPNRPTKMGLRIGKRLPEREEGEKIDQVLEWERDGQYFHYLTKWMIALTHMGNFLQNKKYFIWANDLAKASRKFIHNGRMFWKMSIDLSRPLITSMGQHDPLDGYVTFKVVDMYSEEKLGPKIKEVKEMAQKIQLVTDDPLGIGNMLVDAFRLYQMEETDNLLSKIIESSNFGLQCVDLTYHNLAFRELGLAIGLEAAKRMKKLEQFLNLKEEIIEFWLDHRNWKEHKDINQVMLATSLIPSEFLGI